MIEISTLNSAAQPRIRATYCSSFFCKFKGLMFKRCLPENEGILLVEKKESIIDTSIHMFFMFFDIATIWINAENIVVDVQLAKKWHPFYASKKPAQYVLECHSSQLSKFKIGDQVSIKHV